MAPRNWFPSAIILDPMVRFARRFPAPLPVLLAACAATTPSPPGPRETLVVLNAGDVTLTLVSLAGDPAPELISLGSIGGTPTALAARGSRGLITTGAGSSVASVDLGSERTVLVYRLAPAGGAAGAAFVNDTLAYIANPRNNRVTRLNLRTGDTLSLAVGKTPTAVAVTRGRVYVANANLISPCDPSAGCVAGASWLSVIDPDHNTVVDSIALPGPGNATAMQLGGDGLLYVLSAGPGGDQPGRLSIVDPVLRQEVGSFGGFGILPGRLATDGRERLFVTSPTQGLMEFNTRIRRVVRGAGEGIPLQYAAGASVDAAGLIYALESGNCSGGHGRLRVFHPDLTEARIIQTGACSIDASIVKLPPSP